MPNNKRIERIIKRAISYNNGLLTPSAFATLEEMDGEHDEKEDIMHISFIKQDRIAKAINEILDQDDEDFFKPKPEPEPKTPPFTMTVDEWYSLSLTERNNVYKEHPDEIRNLLHPVEKVQIDIGKYRAMSLNDQQKLFDEMPDKVTDLIKGNIPFIEREVQR